MGVAVSLMLQSYIFHNNACYLHRVPRMKSITDYLEKEEVYLRLLPT